MRIPTKSTVILVVAGLALVCASGAAVDNPLANIDALRNVQFVMKDGRVFRQDGVMTPVAFFHAGPVNGWNIR